MFAIDFGARSIKVAKLNKIGNNYELDNYGITLSPEKSIANGEILNPIAVADSLSKLLKEINLRDNRAIIAVTGQKVIVREIVLPLMEEKELMAGVIWEAPKYVPYNIEESIIDAKKIEEFEDKEGNKMMRILLVAVPKSVVQPYVEVLKKVKVIPKIVDIVSSAHIRAFESYFSEVKEEDSLTDLILSIGASGTILTLVEKGNLKFTRDILMGGNDINEAIAKSLNLSFKEAEKIKREAEIKSKSEEESENESKKMVAKILEQIAKEVRKSLSYYKTQNQKVKYNKIILCGGSANINGITEFLSEELDLPAELGDPLRGIIMDERVFSREDIENFKKDKASLATVIGLAKRER